MGMLSVCCMFNIIFDVLVDAKLHIFQIYVCQSGFWHFGGIFVVLFNKALSQGCATSWETKKPGIV